MESEYITREEYNRVRKLLTPDNRLALDVSIETGLRIDDVLSLRAENLSTDNHITYTASKTGKNGTVKIPKRLADRLRGNAAFGWFFPHAKDKDKHRTRQAVWKNLRDKCAELGFAAHISPHSARKTFAAELYRKKGFRAVQRALQHDNAGTTMLYAYSDIKRAGARAPATQKENDEILGILREIRDILRQLI